MSLKLITFKTNHTILGDVTEEKDFVYIKQSVQVIHIPPKDREEYSGIAFSPFMEFSEEFKTGIKLQKSDILTICTPITELINQYNKIFGSGIQIASSL
jgi:hypothetical protein